MRSHPGLHSTKHLHKKKMFGMSCDKLQETPALRMYLRVIWEHFSPCVVGSSHLDLKVHFPWLEPVNRCSTMVWTDWQVRTMPLQSTSMCLKLW